MATNKRCKKWVAPELLVMVRNKPEEDVLTSCKTSSGGGPQSGQKQCVGPANKCTTTTNS